MQVLSLFDGMSCGQIALNRIGIKPSVYYAAEIDEPAITITKDNYPSTVHLGDVTKWYEWPVDWESIDLLIGGSPCQGFSFAGKQLAFDDPRSKLFFVFLDILSYLKMVNPKVKFMLENVKMKKEHLAVITENLGVEPVLINSALVSAQNRQRFYWCNWPVSQPKDRGIMLADILEHGVVDRDKAFCIDANFRPSNNLRQYKEKSRRQMVFKLNDNPRVGAVTENECGYRPHRGDLRGTGLSEVGRLTKPTAKTGTITAAHAPKLALNSDINNLYYRKLTPIECERLQTVPDNYTASVSNTQRYRMLGNGWTVDVIAHIFCEGLL